MGQYTIVGIHDTGLGWIVHSAADTATKALSDFESMDKGVALAVFVGHLSNKVPRNLLPGSPTKLED